MGSSDEWIRSWCELVEKVCYYYFILLIIRSFFKNFTFIIILIIYKFVIKIPLFHLLLFLLWVRCVTTLLPIIIAVPSSLVFTVSPSSLDLQLNTQQHRRREKKREHGREHDKFMLSYCCTSRYRMWSTHRSTSIQKSIR